MSMSWELIVECLRHEVQEYGALMKLFEEQQQCVLRRDPDQLLVIIGQLEMAVKSTQVARQHREQCVAKFASEHGCATGCTLRALLPHFEPEACPLIEALIDEINLLVHRVRRTSRQNQMLLSRSLELHQDTLREIAPEAFVQTYSSLGRKAFGTNTPIPAYRAAG